jgi:transcriptional regulator with GAF, ATPase, and Fis domain
MKAETPPLLIGESAAIRELREEIERVAYSDAKVLITGESGTGKELVAREIHSLSPRAMRPFVPVNCAGLPETLLESELFGYVRGSFTGAYRDRPGKMEAADTGTIFLDEIGEMTLRMQGLLLRFLETGEVQKVGADRLVTHVNVRVVGATNRDLRELMTQGQFREDLYYRLNVVHLSVLPLRSRREDIPTLVEHFLNRFNARRLAGDANGNPNGTGPSLKDPQRTLKIPPPVMEAMSEYDWPGNVRELQNVVERLVVTARNEVVRLEDLPANVRAARNGSSQPFKERRRTVADDLYRRVVKDGESFWTAVYPLYMQREITRSNVREVIRRGLEDARGNYKIVARIFNMAPEDYKRFLNFLRKHDCQLPFKEYR